MSTTNGNMKSLKVTDKAGNVYVLAPVDNEARQAIDEAKNLQFDDDFFTSEVSQDQTTVSVGLNGVPIGIDTDSPLKFVQDNEQGIVFGSDAPFSTALAPEYDSTATYAAGDHCMHLGKYYRCDTAISTAEAWTPAHWTETNIIGDLSTVLTSKAGASGGTELSLVTTGEKYTWTSWVDASYTIPPETITIGGRAYRIVTIGNQQWMAENLDYTWSDLKVDQYGVGSYDIQRKTNYYDNNPTLYSQYGRLYDWYAADHLNSNLATIIGSRLASDGWHVPSPTDFDTLVTYAGGSSTAGTKLKATSGWSGRGGTDDYGFTWLPGGTTGNSGGQIEYYRGGQWGFIWAISASSSSSTVYPYAAYFDEAGCNTRSMNKGDEVSIRLVRNLT